MAQPGVGDGGGMNVYVRELVSSLSQTGVECIRFDAEVSGCVERSGDPVSTFGALR